MLKSNRISTLKKKKVICVVDGDGDHGQVSECDKGICMMTFCVLWLDSYVHGSLIANLDQFKFI